MPVYVLENEMPYTELLKWTEFFKRRPPGWREDQRTYLMLRSQGVKEKAENIFPTLRMLAVSKEENQTPDKAVPQGKFLELMKKAKGGDGHKL
jgi:hypothetical protein